MFEKIKYVSGYGGWGQLMLVAVQCNCDGDWQLPCLELMNLFSWTWTLDNVLNKTRRLQLHHCYPLGADTDT